MLTSTRNQGVSPVPERSARVIRLKELTRLIGLSRSTIYDRMNPKSKRFDPSFPRPIKLGLASVGWNLSEVMAWITSRPQAHPIKVTKE
jgi:prophage regulatory protein